MIKMFDMEKTSSKIKQTSELGDKFNKGILNWAEKNNLEANQLHAIISGFLREMEKIDPVLKMVRECASEFLDNKGKQDSELKGLIKDAKSSLKEICSEILDALD